MSNLHTDNPVALQALMNETLFSNGFLSAATEEIDSAEPEYRTLPKAPVETSATTEFIYQGDKKTGILFILRYGQYPYFSPAAEEAFTKTIGALQLTPQTVAVVNLANAHNPNDFKRIMHFFEPKKIILLGVEPASLKLPAIGHNAYMKGRIATVFNTFSFEEMFADVNKKKLFWQEFKTFIMS